jgi:hypothetical protein
MRPERYSKLPPARRYTTVTEDGRKIVDTNELLRSTKVRAAIETLRKKLAPVPARARPL